MINAIPRSRRFGWIAAPIGDSAMKKINLWAYHVIGHALHEITQLDADPLSKIYLSFYHAKNAIDSLSADNPLQLSERTISALQKLGNQLESCLNLGGDTLTALSRHRDAVESQRVRDTRWVVHQAIELAEKLEATLSEEFEGLSTFFIPQKGTHKTALLMENAVGNLPPHVVLRLSTDSVNNINAAGRCLALEVPTAAGFHMLRAIEALMRDYYFKLSGQILPLKSRNWGAFIKQLDKHGADQKVTGFLTHIKDFYRNPIVHPEENLTHDQAFGLFNASLSAIIMLDAAIYP